jgi:PAS domain S-box-containing protein
LAAFEPLPALGLGLVAKIDMAEINGRYLRAGLVAGFVSLVAVVGAALLFIQLGEPMIRRMRESESRYRALFENMDMGVVVYQSLAGGEDFAFRDFNRAAEQISQLGRQQVINKRLTDMFPGAEEFGAIEVMRRVWQTSRPERLPTRYYRDGRIAGWWDVYVYKLPTGEIVTLFADVTARKEAERALSESENRMRALLDASQDEILLLGIEGDVLAINKAAEHRLARRANGTHLIGARLDRLFSHDQAESRLTRVREVAATRNALHCEVPVRSRWFDFWYYPVVLPDKPVTEVAVYAREVTEQKKLLTDLSKLFQALQQSPMSVIITDREGTIEYINPEFTKVTGYTTEEAIGQNPRILKSGRMPPELYKELWQTITAGGVWRGELLNKKKNGELYWELASIGAVKDGEKLSNFVAVKEDITARREMEEQLRQSQKMQVVGQLTGGIAHDFNNLLAIVIGNVQLLRERLGNDDIKAREFLDDALWSARRAGELTHRLLAFARKQPLKPSVIDLNDVVRGMSELLRRTLGAQIHIEESLAADVWKAVADRGELERVIVNLAVNSRDAMPTGGTLSLETRNALLDKDYCEQYEEVRPGEYVLLAVTDTGVGMSSEIVQRVFEPFFTTKEMGEGSGLGLSMVYGFVKQSGGHISIYSRVGHGTSVKIYLPRVPSSPDGWVDDPSDATAGDFGSHVVLVVEDEPKLRKAAVKMLAAGFARYPSRKWERCRGAFRRRSSRRSVHRHRTAGWDERHGSR